MKLRSNTTTIVPVGPFIGSNGSTLVTTVDLSECEQAEFMSDNTDVVTDISGFTMSAITSNDGYYALVLTDDCLQYPGNGSVCISSARTALPVRNNFEIVTEFAYDRDFATEGTGGGYLSGVEWYGTFGALADTTIALPAGHGLTGGRVLVVLHSGTNAAGKSRFGTLATNTITVDPSWVSDGETRPSDNPVGYVTAAPKSPTSSPSKVDVIQVSGDASAADNMEAAFDGTGYTSGLTVAGVTNTSAWTIAGDTNTATLIGALNDIDGSAVSVHPSSVVSADLKKIVAVTLIGDGNATPFNVEGQE